MGQVSGREASKLSPDAVSREDTHMSQDVKKKSWPSIGAHFLGRAESAVLILIGFVLVVLAVLMLESAVVSVLHAAQEGKIREEAMGSSTASSS